MGTIRKKGNQYLLRAYLGKDINGKQLEKRAVYIPEPGMNAKAAEKEAERQMVLMEARARGDVLYNGDIRFVDFGDIWIQNHAEANLRPRTVARYKELLAVINLEIGHIPLSRITPTHLLDFYAKLRESPAKSSTYRTTRLPSLIAQRKYTKVYLAQVSGVSQSTIRTACRGEHISRNCAEKLAKAFGLQLSELFRPTNASQPLSATTIRHYHRLIVNILNAAVQWQYIPHNPALRVAAPRAATPEMAYLTDEQAKQLLSALNKAPGYYRRLISLLLLTGLRRSELLGLQWRDVDFRAKSLTICRTTQALPQQGVYTEQTKNRTSRRIVALSQPAVDILLEQQQWQAREAARLSIRATSIQWICTDQKCELIHPDRLTHWFRHFIDRECPTLPRIGLHSLRHTYATLALGAGAPLPAVSQQLGHSNVATTARIYTHALQKQQFEAALRVGDMLVNFLDVENT